MESGRDRPEPTSGTIDGAWDNVGRASEKREPLSLSPLGGFPRVGPGIAFLYEQSSSQMNIGR